ncbi:unnamed protein product, partial [Heterotrigona itama]
MDTNWLRNELIRIVKEAKRTVAAGPRSTNARHFLPSSLSFTFFRALLSSNFISFHFVSLVTKRMKRQLDALPRLIATFIKRPDRKVAPSVLGFRLTGENGVIWLARICTMRAARDPYNRLRRRRRRPAPDDVPLAGRVAMIARNRRTAASKPAEVVEEVGSSGHPGNPFSPFGGRGTRSESRICSHTSEWKRRGKMERKR